MSRRRRGRGVNPDDLLGELGNNEVTGTDFGDLSASDIADAGYGSTIGHNDTFAKLGRGREKIIRVSIEDIQPNVMQPRRAIPAVMSQYWSGQVNSESMAHFFNQWLDEIDLERKQANREPFPLDAYLAGEATPRAQHAESDEEQLEQIPQSSIGPKEMALMTVIDLAASIFRDGLVNPISIAQNGQLYEIETGERRWLAYHLLNWRFGHESDEWQKISTRQVTDISIWRQADENNARADLNAIEKARQFALLLMNIRANEKGDEFQLYHAFEYEQGYYAQVADGTQYKIPYGTGEKLINAMGIRDVGQLRHLRRLLRLPNIVWILADDLNWSENFIQKSILVNADEDDMIRRAVSQALKERYPEYLLEEYLPLLEQSSVMKSTKSRLTFSDLAQSSFPKLEKQISALSKNDRNQVVEYLEDLLERLKVQ
jgi:ParB-like nuclease family protein